MDKLQIRRLLNHYFLLTWLIVLAITGKLLDFTIAWQAGARPFWFLVTAWLCYAWIYLLPAYLLTRLAAALLHRRDSVGLPAPTPLVFITAWLSTGLTTMVLYTNTVIHELFGFFINGFVLNLIMTPGGIESMGGSDTSNNQILMILGSFILLQGVLLLALHRLLSQPRGLFSRWALPARLYPALLALFIAATIGERLTYGISHAQSYSSVTTLAQDIPFYSPTTMSTLMRKLGYKVVRDTRIGAASGQLRYPLNPLKVQTPAKPLNVVWLVSESWRWDTLDPEIMPATWQFAQESQRFTRHYSGGNGTRVGVFTMFTGVPGSYWFQFLGEHKGPILIDTLRQQNYQMHFWTSAKFSYPEFDKTVFAAVPNAQLTEATPGLLGWENDRKNVSSLLDFIDKRDATKPFFTFMFFESPHARYHFPKESEIRRPYKDDVNYATLSREELTGEMPLIKNRYINAVHHLDSQFARVIDHLKTHNLLDNTLVVMLGDHGEEFMEVSRWGHNSEFTDYQTRTPLIVHVPGRTPKQWDKLTSHMDLPATVAPLLGVQNPASDYTIGLDVFGKKERSYTYFSDWNRIGYMDNDVKIVLPVKAGGVLSGKFTTADDKPLPAAQFQKVMAQKQPALIQMMRDMGAFVEKGKKH